MLSVAPGTATWRAFLHGFSAQLFHESALLLQLRLGGANLSLKMRDLNAQSGGHLDQLLGLIRAAFSFEREH